MKNNKYLLNTLLAIVVGTGLMIALLIRSFAPAIILPDLNIPAVTGLSLIALLLEYYLGNRPQRCWICVPVLGVVTFGLLPLASGAIALSQLLRIALVGGGIFTAITWIFDSLTERIQSGPAGKLAPVLTAFVLYLVSQCFIGILI